MPANPGAKRATEKKNRKRPAAQLARKQATERARSRATPLGEDDVVDATVGVAADGPFGGTRPDDFDDLDRLAVELKAALKAKKLDLAERKAAEMVRRFPREPDGWQGFAGIAEARGDLKRALAEMERAAERAPTDDVGTRQEIDKQLVRLRALVDRGR
ncbi:MAG: hypothetical protein NVS3B10_04910 [Polyangiales bacterium]